MTEMIDRVAAAIREKIGTRHQGLPKGGWDGLMRMAAQAAIEAMREPTDQMLIAAYGINGEWNGSSEPARTTWQEMIDAAISPARESEE